MRFRGPVLAGAALVFLASRLLGLHFHSVDRDHDHHSEPVAAVHVQADADDHHLDDHLLNGDRDVESIALPTDRKPAATVAVLFFCQGDGALREPIAGAVRVEKPPLPPPRRSRSAFNLPPSRGPPILA
jgi:hypothetical protein